MTAVRRRGPPFPLSQWPPFARSFARPPASRSFLFGAIVDFNWPFLLPVNWPFTHVPMTQVSFVCSGNVNSSGVIKMDHVKPTGPDPPRHRGLVVSYVGPFDKTLRILNGHPKRPGARCCREWRLPSLRLETSCARHRAAIDSQCT